jgi:hypothetical protein
MVAGPFITRGQAAAFARVSESLLDQAATVRALQHEVGRSGDTRSKGARILARRLARLLVKAPSRYRALAAAFAFQPVPVTDEVLGAWHVERTLVDVRRALRRFGAPRSLTAKVNGSLNTSAAGDNLDPLASFRDPTLDELGQRAAVGLLSR